MAPTRSMTTRRATASARRVSVVPAAAGVLLLALLTSCGAGESETAVPSTTPVDQVSESTAPSEDSLATSAAAAEVDGAGSVDLALLDENQQRFESTVGSDYLLVFDVVSSVTAEAGPVQVEVRDRRPVSVDYPDAMTEQILPEIPLLTVADMFSRARAVIDDGGLVEIDFDASYGYPTGMGLDPIPSAIDDELSITVRSVEPLDPITDEVEGY